MLCVNNLFIIVVGKLWVAVSSIPVAQPVLGRELAEMLRHRFSDERVVASQNCGYMLCKLALSGRNITAVVPNHTWQSEGRRMTLTTRLLGKPNKK